MSSGDSAPRQTRAPTRDRDVERDAVARGAGLSRHANRWSDCRGVVRATGPLRSLPCHGAPRSGRCRASGTWCFLRLANSELDAARVTAECPLLRAIFRYVPAPLAAAYWRWYLGGARREIFFAAHARHAGRETAEIAEEIGVVIRASGIQAPTFDRLRRSIPT
jgi:hypothetical protein